MDMLYLKINVHYIIRKSIILLIEKKKNSNFKVASNFEELLLKNERKMPGCLCEVETKAARSNFHLLAAYLWALNCI